MFLPARAQRFHRAQYLESYHFNNGDKLDLTKGCSGPSLTELKSKTKKVAAGCK